MHKLANQSVDMMCHSIGECEDHGDDTHGIDACALPE